MREKCKSSKVLAKMVPSRVGWTSLIIKFYFKKTKTMKPKTHVPKDSI